jgi:hypothetical protein
MARIPRRLVALSATGAVAVAAAAGLAVVASATPTASLPKLTIAMNGSTISVGGALQSGGVNVVSTTTIEPQGAPLLFRLNPGVTAAQVQAYQKAHPNGDPNSLAQFGAIVFNAEADRGVSQVQTTLQPGNYAAVDTGPGNHGKNPITTFTITPAAHPAVLPTPGGTVSTIEFAFRGAGVLHRGEVVRFINRGFLVHMVIGFRVPNMAAAIKDVQLLKAGKDNQVNPVGQPFAFNGGVSPGAYQQMTITQHAGIWILACFMDTQDGREHTQLGMERIIRILK